MILGSVLLVAGVAPIPLLSGSYLGLVVPLVVTGLGWGLLVPTTSAAGLARAQRGKEGVASGVTAGGREFGAALARPRCFPLACPGSGPPPSSVWFRWASSFSAFGKWTNT